MLVMYNDQSDILASFIPNSSTYAMRLTQKNESGHYFTTITNLINPKVLLLNGFRAITDKHELTLLTLKMTNSNVA